MPASFTATPSSNTMSSLSLEAQALSGASGGAFSSLNTATTTVPVIPEPQATLVDEALAGGSGSEEGGNDGKKKKNRCQSCKKKLGLTGFTCRCGGLYCSIHRYSDKHVCGFDYKALGAEEITRSNPVVVAQKVAKI